MRVHNVLSYLLPTGSRGRTEELERARAANERRIEELRTQSRRLRKAIRRLQEEGADDG